MVSVQAENAVSYHDDRVTERLEQLELTTAEGSWLLPNLPVYAVIISQLVR